MALSEKKQGLSAIHITGLVIGGLLVLLLAVQGGRDAGKVETPTPATPEPAEQRPKPAVHVDIDATFTTEGTTDKARAREQTAMRAVYDLCSRFAVWREGTKLSANFVEPNGKYRYGFANVDVHLAREDQVANGNMLPYRIDFDKRGEAVAIMAWKDIAAELCGIDEGSVTYKLADLKR